MDRCTNCGAAIRPGAKFCTSCGTRLNDEPATAADSSWSAAVRHPADDPNASTSSTSDWGTPDEEPDEDVTALWPSAATKEPDTTGVSWDSIWHRSSDRDDDANDARSADTSAPEADTSTPKQETQRVSDTWTTRDESTSSNETDDREDASAGASTTTSYISEREATNDAGTESPTIEPMVDQDPEETSTTVRYTADESAADRDAAGFSDAKEIDALSGDENLTSEASAPVTSVQTTERGPDVRQEASDLIEQLRELIWSIGSEPTEGDGKEAALQLLTAARGQAGDFSDLEGMITTVREQPRDIDALRSLAHEADRLDSLLENYKTLTNAVNDAIGKLQT